MKTILLLCFPLFLHAQNFSFNKETGKATPNFVAELKLLKGRVLRTTGGRPRVVQLGEKFYPNDTVETDERSMMKVLVADDTWLSLGPSSEIRFSEFEFREKTDRKISFDLRRGRLAANIRRPVRSGAVNFRTRFTSMGVRGTKILMNYREVNGLGITEYALIEGKAEVTDSQGKSQEIRTGERIVLINHEKSKEAREERLALTDTDIDSFTSPDADEEKEIRPFLPFYEPKDFSLNSTGHPATRDSGTVSEGPQGEGTFSNLKKLNEQLQENQKKKR